jgi:hypothetical protein
MIETHIYIWVKATWDDFALFLYVSFDSFVYRDVHTQILTSVSSSKVFWGTKKTWKRGREG